MAARDDEIAAGRAGMPRDSVVDYLADAGAAAWVRGRSSAHADKVMLADALRGCLDRLCNIGEGDTPTAQAARDALRKAGA